MRSLTLLLLLSGCVMDAPPFPPHQIAECLNIRSGERFTIHSENVSNVEVGIGGTCFDVVDDKGQKHPHLCQNNDSALRCHLVNRTTQDQ